MARELLAPIRVTLEVIAFKEISAVRLPDLFCRKVIVAATTGVVGAFNIRE